MHIGLIAGNGRFPFLVLDAARGAGHDVTVIALKEEAFPALAESRRRVLRLHSAHLLDRPRQRRRRALEQQLPCE